MPGAGNWALSESISVPPEMVLRAQRLGATQIVYERSFDDGLAAAVSRITLQLVGAAGGDTGGALFLRHHHAVVRQDRLRGSDDRRPRDRRDLGVGGGAEHQRDQD